ncbi:WbqC family protein [Winogradskyella sediminis]|uniref:WbqC family protein n=1 Tax=Winogradskyella sediminis TaxID=1382466 RepID=UPI003AA87A70
MSKGIAIMQPYIFPYIGYFQLVNYVDKFVFYNDVNFIKQGWINRNKILVNDKELLFTIPLINGSSNTLIHDVNINHNIFRKTRKKFYKSIEQSYGKSAYFSEVNEIIRNVMELETDSISEMAEYSIKTIAQYVGLNTEFSNSKNVYKNKSLHGQNRVIDIVLKEEATRYTNPIGGIKLYDSETFKDNGIELSFIKVDENLNDLLILDILMNFSKEGIRNILNQYVIVT